MKTYHDLLKHVLVNGKTRTDRTGTGTQSVFGAQARFDLREGFPLLTTKKVHLKGIIHELLWFLKGDTNVKYLQDNGVTIWDAWSDANGDLGPVYGHQWRSWTAPDGTVIDQIATAINQIRETPDSRRIIVSAWNPADVPGMALPPCHTMFQFYVDTQARTLSCQLYQRSGDAGIGIPYNIASYALLTMMVAQVTGYTAGEFIHTFGDLHIYSNHREQLLEQLSRVPRELPVMQLNPTVQEIDDFVFEDFTLVGYDPHPAIKMPVAI